LLTPAVALMAAAWMKVRDNNGGRAEDGALAPLLAVPCPLARRQRWWQCKQMAAVQKLVPCWHCQLFLAFSCNGGNGSGTNDGAH
jgi:hypothetical protein